jgi:hypothetical protein
MSLDRVFAIVLGILMIPLGIWIWRKASAKNSAVYYQLGKFGGLFVSVGVVLVLIGLGVVQRH